jgi:aryl-alcohol dehydrogenase-like predicted oxidoreductase
VIERIEFGRTGHRSSRVIFGAAALGAMRQETADRLLPLLLAHGVNHLDTAAAYGDSELRLAPWLAGRPGEFFLATKTGERRGDAARAELERSLDRLGVDHVDLIQLHNLVETDEWDVAHGPHGAIAALARARDEGLVRFIGVTGHGLRIPGMHRRSLERFDFDSVLLPYSYVMLQLDDYRRDVEELLALCAERRVAVQTIKSMARRRWTDDSQPHYAWYEPLADAGAIERSVRWVLDRPGLFLNTSSDTHLLEATLRAADSPRAEAPSEDEMAADVAAQGVVPLFDGSELEGVGNA